MSPLEISANAMTAVCIVLAGRNNVHTWWTGIVACVLFAWLFLDAKLYADVTLQAFFVVTGVIGWRNWSAAGDNRPISSASGHTLTVMVGCGLAGALAYGLLLHSLTDAYAPFVDSLVLAFSIVGQLLLMRRNVESWPIWLLVNTLSVPLYLSRELYLTAALYGAFWVNAAVAWYHWSAIASKKEAAA